MTCFRFLSSIVISAAFVAAAPQPRSQPSVSTNGGTFVGTSLLGVDKFLGIPFAQPPTGNRRFRLPEPIAGYSGTYDASQYGNACPNQKANDPQLPSISGLALDTIAFLDQLIYTQDPGKQDEDCLTLNVVKPSDITADSKLPVLVWIYGGGFETGTTSMYDGSPVVAHSQALGQPVIFVSMNYRLNAFGFIAGKEVRDAGVANLGLHDQREALRWVQKNIAAFGGDPSKVTIWGESAGAMSVALHMLANGGKTDGLFRGGFMQSGAVLPVGPLENGQEYYDYIVENTGCSGHSDTLQCLRDVPYDTLKGAIDKTPGLFSYQALRLAWLPRVDGNLITDHPFQLVREGKVADIPYVSGNCDDEGTLFALPILNVSTTQQFKGWIRGTFLPGLPEDKVNGVAEHYPSDTIQGSPFDTGILNAITPQFKRIAAFLGDGVFQAPRRLLLHQTANRQNTWAYASKRLKLLPILGSAHTTDLLNSFFLGQEMSDHVIYFANNLDPNGGSNKTYWPKYTLENKQMLVYQDSLLAPLTLTTDSYRPEAMDFLTQLVTEHPV
ncbi:carotenoid ester lipase [Coprinopsis sp. MPI-PUGE-AT-0042]|nr:carotenoid ester lipase [Coprinopsis sp. MPI-PUGE-AT-0042]